MCVCVCVRTWVHGHRLRKLMTASRDRMCGGTVRLSLIPGSCFLRRPPDGLLGLCHDFAKYTVDELLPMRLMWLIASCGS